MKQNLDDIHTGLSCRIKSHHVEIVTSTSDFPLTGLQIYMLVVLLKGHTSRSLTAPILRESSFDLSMSRAWFMSAMVCLAFKIMAERDVNEEGDRAGLYDVTVV
jgi:hypothetical protein